MKSKKRFVFSILAVTILIACALAFPFIKTQFVFNNFMPFSSYILDYEEATSIENTDLKVSIISEMSLNEGANVKFSSFVYYPNCDQLSYAIYYKPSEYERRPAYLFDTCSPMRYKSEEIYKNKLDYFITRGTGLIKGVPKTFILYESGNKKIGAMQLIWK